MKKIYILFAVFMIGMSCKQKGSSSLTETDSTKTINEINNSVDLWSKAYKDKFISRCITNAAEKIGASRASDYCICMAAKVEAKYSVESDVDAKLTNADVDSMKSDCLSFSGSSQAGVDNQSGSTGWSSFEQKLFVDNCVRSAAKPLGNSDATKYCECLLNKIMQAYPDSKDVDNIPKEQLSTFATDCLSKR